MLHSRKYSVTILLVVCSPVRKTPWIRIQMTQMLTCFQFLISWKTTEMLRETSIWNSATLKLVVQMGVIAMSGCRPPILLVKLPSLGSRPYHLLSTLTATTTRGWDWDALHRISLTLSWMMLHLESTGGLLLEQHATMEDLTPFLELSLMWWKRRNCMYTQVICIDKILL